MPPRRSARVAAAAEAATSALQPLPLSIVLRIFSLVPVDYRLRCAEVCRGWRAVLSERSLWTRLDLRAATFVGRRWIRGSDDALLRCAAARAGGGLQSLIVRDCHLADGTLLAVAAANAGTLRELHCARQSPVDVRALLRAAPLLSTYGLEWMYFSTAERQDVRLMLRNDAPFGPLCMQRLIVCLGFNAEVEADVVAFAADMAAHASLRGLHLKFTDMSMAALAALVDVALALRFHTLTFKHCNLFPDYAPVLARLLSGGALTTLEFEEIDLFMDDDITAGELAAALRTAVTLTSLDLFNTGVFTYAERGVELLGALTGHPSLRVLSWSEDVSMNGSDVTVIDDVTALGAAFGALIAANAPALMELSCGSELEEGGLRPLFEALPHNTHLRSLACCYDEMTEGFARDVLLPAVRANTALRSLRFNGRDYTEDLEDDEELEELESVREAQRLVAQRGSDD